MPEVEHATDWVQLPDVESREEFPTTAGRADNTVGIQKLENEGEIDYLLEFYPDVHINSVLDQSQGADGTAPADRLAWVVSKRWLDRLYAPLPGIMPGYDSAQNVGGAGGYVMDFDPMREWYATNRAAALAAFEADPPVPLDQMLYWTIDWEELPSSSGQWGSYDGRQIEVEMTSRAQELFARSGSSLGAGATYTLDLGVTTLPMGRAAEGLVGTEYDNPIPYTYAFGAWSKHALNVFAFQMAGETDMGLVKIAHARGETLSRTGFGTVYDVDNAWWEANAYYMRSPSGGDWEWFQYRNRGLALLIGDRPFTEDHGHDPSGIVGGDSIVDPYPMDKHIVEEIRGKVWFSCVWTPPRYRIRYATETTIAPVLRHYPRDGDGRGWGGVVRHYPPPRGRRGYGGARQP